MITQTPAKIFLADNRSKIENLHLRSFSTLGKPAGRDNSFSTMYAFDDTELAGGATVRVNIIQPSYVLLLPITGNLNYIDGTGQEMSIDNGEAIVIQVSGDFIVLNPYPDEVINYLQVLFRADQATMLNSTWKFSFDLEAGKNGLITLQAADMPFSFSIGRFKGRTEGLYRLKNTASNLFTFVLTGAFEVEHRLLQQHDSLAMNTLKEFEFEALSEYAILICIEIFGHPLPHLGN